MHVCDVVDDTFEPCPFVLAAWDDLASLYESHQLLVQPDFETLHFVLHSFWSKTREDAACIDRHRLSRPQNCAAAICDRDQSQAGGAGIGQAFRLPGIGGGERRTSPRKRKAEAEVTPHPETKPVAKKKPAGEAAPASPSKAKGKAKAQAQEDEADLPPLLDPSIIHEYTTVPHPALPFDLSAATAHLTSVDPRFVKLLHAVELKPFLELATARSRSWTSSRRSRYRSSVSRSAGSQRVRCSTSSVATSSQTSFQRPPTGMLGRARACHSRYRIEWSRRPRQSYVRQD